MFRVCWTIWPSLRRIWWNLVPKLVPLHNLTGILRILLEERVPISDLRSILETLPGLAARNLNPWKPRGTAPRACPAADPADCAAEPAPSGHNARSDLEHMLITMVRQVVKRLILDNSCRAAAWSDFRDHRGAERTGTAGRAGGVARHPRQFSQLIRQHIDDLAVLAFTELPDSRKIDVVAHH